MIRIRGLFEFHVTRGISTSLGTVDDLPILRLRS